MAMLGRATAVDGPFSANVFGLTFAHSLNMYTPSLKK
jgi:hypothetical protein